MNRCGSVRKIAWLAPALATWIALLVGTGAASAVSPAEIEARVRQIYIEGYPITNDDRLESIAVERLGEMLLDEAEQAYWANIVLALGASENPDAYRHLADFASRRPGGEVSSGMYQAQVSLPVALGNLAESHPAALALIAAMARDTRPDPGWRFQSLEGPSLAGVLRRSAITGLAVSGRPEAAVVLSELEAGIGDRGAGAAGAAAAQSDQLSKHLESARTLHERAASRGAASVLRREPVTR